MGIFGSIPILLYHAGYNESKMYPKCCEVKDIHIVQKTIGSVDLRVRKSNSIFFMIAFIYLHRKLDLLKQTTARAEKSDGRGWRAEI